MDSKSFDENRRSVTEEANELPPMKGRLEGPFREHRKDHVVDVEVMADIHDSSLFFQKRLERIFAVSRRFMRVSFKQVVIRDCYFRNCEFIDCDFTGAHISSSNFQGAKFEGCNFSYATFEKTEIELDVITHNLPPYENLKRDLARSIRTNYESIGNYDGVNAAILVELSATLEHYRKAAFSAEAHYRRKHKGLNRAKYAGKYFGFWILDKLWGNGERPWRLVWTALCVWLLGTIYGIWGVGLPISGAIATSASEFVLGSGSELGKTVGIILALTRYLVLGMFLASLVKRLARR
ncbi:pentapeptide repeat-containing protein [Halomonas caseinilytica]|uniref:pentapeptide repeat-containing protein n=1 Tax=Halomonas caseinilytica TaxID=438744 RepID=UPI0009EE9673|nr:pentapeptide repeat-containing protein [Halomonas caseinilytica]